MDIQKLGEPLLSCVTTHNEYFISRGRCVAVRTLASGTWLEDHFAIDERVSLNVCRRARANDPLVHDLWVHTFDYRIRSGKVRAIGDASPEDVAEVRSQILARYAGGRAA